MSADDQVMEARLLAAVLSAIDDDDGELVAGKLFRLVEAARAAGAIGPDAWGPDAQEAFYLAIIRAVRRQGPL